MDPNFPTLSTAPSGRYKRRTLIIAGIVLIGVVILIAASFSQFLSTRVAPGLRFEILGPNTLVLGATQVAQWNADSTSRYRSQKIEACRGKLFGQECVTLVARAANDGEESFRTPASLKPGNYLLRFTAVDPDTGELRPNISSARPVKVVGSGVGGPDTIEPVRVDGRLVKTLANDSGPRSFVVAGRKYAITEPDTYKAELCDSKNTNNKNDDTCRLLIAKAKGTATFTMPAELGRRYVKVTFRTAFGLLDFANPNNWDKPVLVQPGAPEPAVAQTDSGGGGGGGGSGGGGGGSDSGGGGSGGGETASDTVTPTISGLAAANVTGTSATISWEASEDSTGVVRFVLDNQVVRSEGTTDYKRAHSFEVAGLSPGTTYAVQAQSADAAGNVGTAEISMQTQASSSPETPDSTPSPSPTTTSPDTKAPTISGLAVTDTTSNSATVRWVTDEASTGSVTVNDGTDALQNFGRAGFFTTHSIALTGLRAGTTYTVTAISRDRVGNQGTSAPQTFSTPATPVVPVLQNLTLAATTVQRGGSVQATVTLDTPAPAGGVTIPLTFNPHTLSGDSPATVVVPAGQNSGSFTITLNSQSTEDSLRISATLGAVTKTAQLSVQAPSGPAADTTPPVISSIAVPAASLTTNSATITWTTNEPATTEIDAGPSNAYGVTTADPQLTTTHTAPVTGLAPGFTYHYRVRSVDAAGNVQQSSDATFTTKFDAVPIDNVPPVISGVGVSQITTTSATISWSVTDASSTEEFVAYGTTGSYGQRTPSTTSRTVTLTALTPNTTYHYQVNSTDVTGNVGRTQDLTFTTAAVPIPPPVVQAVTLASTTVIGGRTATMTVLLDRPAPAGGSQVSLSSNNASKVTLPPNVTISAGAQSVSFDVATSTVTTNTLVTITASLNNSSQAAGLTLQPEPTTPTDTTPPVISAAAASEITQTAARILWITNEASTTEVDAGPSTAYGVTTRDPNLTITHTSLLTGLVPNTTYHYRVRSVDAVGNRQESGDFTFTTLADVPPPDTTAPIISNVQIQELTTTSARVSWTSNEAGSTTVFHGPTSSYGQAVAAAANTTTVTITGLTPATLYHYQVQITDAAGNVGRSTDGTFTTAQVRVPSATFLFPTAQNQGDVFIQGQEPIEFRVQLENIVASDLVCGGWYLDGQLIQPALWFNGILPNLNVQPCQ